MKLFRRKNCWKDSLGKKLSGNRNRSHAIVNFGVICNKDFAYIRQAINYAYDEKQKETLCEKLVKYEKITDNIEFEIAAYLNDVSKANTPPSQKTASSVCTRL